MQPIHLAKGPIAVRPLAQQDAPLLLKWMTNPLVLEFYGGRDLTYTPEKIGRVLHPGKGRPPLLSRTRRNPDRLHTNLSAGCSAVPGISLPLPGRGASFWHRPVYWRTRPLEQGDRTGLYFPCDRSPYNHRGGLCCYFRPSRQQSTGPEVLRSLRV